MPYRCCVPKCKGNYPNGPKVSVFAFPKEENLKNKWIRGICRDNFQPSKTSRVCELHFQTHEIERLTSMYDDKTGRKLSAPLRHPRLIDGAVPSQIVECPKHLSKPVVRVRESPMERRERQENEALQKGTIESMETLEVYQQKHSFLNFEQLNAVISDYHFRSDWTLIKKDNYISFLLIEDIPHPTVQCSVQINSELSVFVYFGNIPLKKLDGKLLPSKVGDLNGIDTLINKCHNKFFGVRSEDNNIQHYINNILEILDALEKCSPDKTQITFLREQISLLNTPKSKLRYSPEFLVFCSLLHSLSPHSYNFLRSTKFIELPSRSTLKLMCSKLLTNPQQEQRPGDLLKYIATKFNHLQSKDKNVTLLVDEIHLKTNFDYKGGNIVGSTFNNNEIATSAFVFMICSPTSPYKDVVHILPANKMEGEMLHKIISDILVGLEEIGFEVLAVVTDNHFINRKAMSLFADPPEINVMYQYPKSANKRFFFVFDSVHILKCIRNNWLNQVNQTMSFPDINHQDIIHKASFEALKEMHAAEKNNLLKYGYGLNLKALYPSSIERQNVKLALKIFNRNTVSALRELGPQKHFKEWEGTALYIEAICTWWDIVNVKTPLKGIRLKNQFQQPIVDNCEQLNFLQNFLDWLNRWEIKEGGLTRETHFALKHTTEALIKMALYLIRGKGYSYFLCGKIQTDNLEDRFGKYRQSCLAQYHISVRQIFESESKLRIQSVLPLIFKSNELGNIEVNTIELSMVQFMAVDYGTVEVPQLLQTIIVDDDDIDDITETLWPLLTYIAGCCSYASIKTFKCDYCKMFLINIEKYLKIFFWDITVKIMMYQ